MSSLTTIDKRKLESLFEMGGGYVLDFSDRTFAEFFADTLGVDIWDQRYQYASGSKANRLRAFWRIESDALVGRLLKELLDYYTAFRWKEENRELFSVCQRVSSKLFGKEVSNGTQSVEDFLQKGFREGAIDDLDIDPAFADTIKQRIIEIEKCLKVDAPLAVIFLCGSTLEGLLMGVASGMRQEFLKSPSAPKDNFGKTFPIEKWKLASLIDTARGLDYLGEDAKKFGHALRDFRNYIHPYEQTIARFAPNHRTAKISYQVLLAAIESVGRKKRAKKGTDSS